MNTQAQRPEVIYPPESEIRPLPQMCASEV
jgi:hypothetical protein